MLASWDNTENTTQQHQQFLQMTFTALTDGKLSDHLALLEAPLSSEAYLEKDGDTGTHAIRLKWVQENAAGAGFELFQNKPNPFRGQTSIGFYLPEPSAAVLTVYDLSGRMLQQVKGDYAAGYQEVEIDLSGMETGGGLYYRLQTNDRTATRKMVLIN